MNPRQIPFLRLLLPWAAGIAAGAAANHPVPGLAGGLLTGGAVLVCLAKRRYDYRFRWVFGTLLFLLLFAAGYFHAQAFDERHRKDHFSLICPEARLFIGTVYDAPAKGARLKIPLRLQAAGTAPDSLLPCTGNVLLFCEITPGSDSLQYGDQVWVQASIQPCPPPKNPNAFDYQRYLHFQNIHYQCFVKDRSFGVLATGHGHPLWRVAFQWRQRLLAVLREHFPGTDEYAVASALLVGYTDDLSEDLRTAYAETGSMHALAVSGTHIGLLYAGLLFLSRRIPWAGRSRRWGETALVLGVIWVFTLVTGATASVLRASVMFSAYLAGKAIRRQASVWNILAVSAFLLLTINPYFLFDAGFQLSYAAVAGMQFFYPHLKKITPSLPSWTAEGWNILLIGVAAQLGTLPLSLYYFHQFPAYFWLAGWVVVLGGAVFLWGGALLAVLSVLAPDLGAWLGWVLYGLVWAMNYLIRCIQHLPGSVISGIWVSAWAAVLLYFFIGTLAGAFRLYRPKWLLTALGLFLLLGISRATQQAVQFHQRQITLYHSNRCYLLDFFDGVSRITCTDSISSRQEKFIAQSNRWAHGVRGAIALTPDTFYTGPNLFVRLPLIRFYEKKLAIIDHPRWVQHAGMSPISVDVLIVCCNPNVRLSDCLRQFPSQLVIFGASNSRRRVERWKTECKDFQLPFYDVQEQGAWTMCL